VDTSAEEVRILVVAPVSTAEHGILVAAPASAVEVRAFIPEARAFHPSGRVNLK
jgi:hypothetical protein